MTEVEKLWEKMMTDVSKKWKEKVKESKKSHIPDKTPEHHCPHCGKCPHCGRGEPIYPDHINLSPYRIIYTTSTKDFHIGYF